MRKISIQQNLSKTWLFIIPVLTLCLALIWTGQSSFADRVITVRYLLFSLIALIAFLTPYVLFPDTNVAVLQLGNMPPFSLRKYVLDKVLILSIPIYLLIAFIYFGDLQSPLSSLYSKLIFAVKSISLYCSILIFSVYRYLKSGESSQFWKEAHKDEKQDAFAFFLKYNQVDPSSLPNLLNTILIFATGSALLVIGAVLQQQFTIYAELILFLVTLMLSIYIWTRDLGSFVQNFYTTDAFFREFFGVSLKGEEATEKRKVAQLWWVPARLKMHVWQFLLQIDRKIPAGRAVAAGHVAVWFIAYQRPDPQFLTIIWVLFAIAHQLFTIMSIQQGMSPYWMLRWVDKFSIWTLTRFWMQLRWLVPLLLSMNVQYFILEVPGFTEQAIIVSIYIISSWLVSFGGTIKLKQDLKL